MASQDNTFDPVGDGDGISAGTITSTPHGETPATTTITTITTLPPRNLVVLFDGTGDQFSSAYSNIIKLCGVIKVDDEQLMFYDSGIGSYLPSGTSIWGKINQKIAKIMDMAFAWSFRDHVCAGYKFLSNHYRKGDNIYIFGFSRGAYSARSLAGMIQKVGLLPPGNETQLPLAYDVYKSKPKCGKRWHFWHHFKKQPENLAPTYRSVFGISQSVNIHFIGVFDTVASIGGAELRELPFASGVAMVKWFRQALALDERRAKFQPIYRLPNPGEAHKKLTYSDIKQCAQEANEALDTLKKFKVDTPAHDSAKAKLEGKDKSNLALNQRGDKYLPRSKEVWFAGVHTDCGGGNDLNGDASLSNISFRWMLREAEECGLKIDAAGLVLLPTLAEVPGIEPNVLAARDHLSNIVTEELAEQSEYENATLLREEAEMRDTIRNEILPLREELHNIIQKAAAHDTELDGNPPAGGPFTSDLYQLPVESLTWPYWILEIAILQARRNAGGSGGLGLKHERDEGDNDYKWRQNRFRGRVMLETQGIHRSVQKRLLLDDIQVGNHPKYATYNGCYLKPRPKAKLPRSWRRMGWTWDLLKDGGDGTEDVWED